MGQIPSNTFNEEAARTSDCVQFSINGEIHKICSSTVKSDTKLNAYIRQHARLKGTKYMCHEGGCGACIVSVKASHAATKAETRFSVNSCLIPVFACHGWQVTTIEGLGGKSKGYHKIQRRLADANGTQCGYCSPAWVMSMFSLMEQKNAKISMQDIEDSFGGNICRCTGYRPILDAFKSFAIDSSSCQKQDLADVEDILQCKGLCHEFEIVDYEQHPLRLSFPDGSTWLRPVSVKEVFQIFDMIGNSSYKLVAGNTSHGVYRDSHDCSTFIDVNGIAQLHEHSVTSTGMTLGANVNLSEALRVFRRNALEMPQLFGYCETLASHIDQIANVSVRNVGTVAGNLMIKYAHPEFPSDVFLILEMVRAKISVANITGVEDTMTLREFLSVDMNKKLITKVHLSSMPADEYSYRSFKICPRAQNAHAYVNAGFLFKTSKKRGFTVNETPVIVYGGINPKFVHASNCENFLKGKNICEAQTLQEALNILEREIIPNPAPPDSSIDHRKGLALALFYKFVLGLNPSAVTDRYKSGGYAIERHLSSGVQDFDTDKRMWPLNQPIPKLEALLQCSGETEYTDDIPSFDNELWGQFVLSDRGGATITSVDFSEASKIDGVMAFFTSKDLPGENSYIPTAKGQQFVPKVFADGVTDYAGQAVGLLVAKTNSAAKAGAKMVKVTYKTPTKLYLNMREIIKKDMKDRIQALGKISPDTEKKDVKKTLTGTWFPKSQYHFTMETISCIVVPRENEIDVYPSSQSTTNVQEAVSLALKIPQNQINVSIRRLGGGYGAKVDQPSQVAVACSLAAQRMSAPVRIVLDMETMAQLMGKRFPYLFNYEVAVNDEGEIQYLRVKCYLDCGCVFSPTESYIALEHIGNGYDSSTWDVQMFGVRTDTAPNTWCRAPGSSQTISFIENVMDHIAHALNKDPISVRLINLVKSSPLPSLIQDVQKSSDFLKRSQAVSEYNNTNRWKKKGISLALMTYPFSYIGNYHATVSLFGMDGTVAISHGAIEMGQGVNTKAAQVAAYTLGIAIEQVTIKPTSSMISPNDFLTGASQASDCVSYAIKMCCEELNKRLAPIKSKLGAKASWVEIINVAYREKIDLKATYMFLPNGEVKNYFVYGVVVSEVELDVLTGQHQILRVDLLEDAGRSLSPEIDIGQIEGAFMMGVGYFTSEECLYDSETGAFLNSRTWNYKPPGVKDIPVDFRVTMRKNAPNEFGVLGSKATGEPPFCLSCSVALALRNAIFSARKDAGNDSWFDLDLPCTVEKLWLNCLSTKKMYQL